MVEQKRCKDVVRSHKQSRMEQIRKLWTLYRQDPEASDDEYGRWEEYGLSFDYAPAGTFNGQRVGFFRFLISWGGPSEEIRFYCDPQFNLQRADFWFMDWFDGAKSRLTGRDLELIQEIWDDWKECEVQKYQYEKATKDE